MCDEICNYKSMDPVTGPTNKTSQPEYAIPGTQYYICVVNDNGWKAGVSTTAGCHYRPGGKSWAYMKDMSCVCKKRFPCVEGMKG